MGKKNFLINDQRGIEAIYQWSKQEGEYFLYPYLDDNKKTILYYAFDTAEQKNDFENLLKISGVGPKTAFQIAQLPKHQLNDAIKNVDAKFFQTIPGVGPKSAKKILLELKGSFDLDDVTKLDIDQKLYKDIVKSLKGFGYDTERVKTVLQTYPEKLEKEHMAKIIKRVIGNI